MTPPGGKLLNEAIELLAKYHSPSDAEKRSAHSDVAEFLLEESSRYVIPLALGGGFHRRFLVYPEKFLRGTWRMLEERGLAHWDSASSDYGVPPALGLLMMSALADSCAGTQLDKVTDRIAAYSIIQRARATLLGAPYIESLDPSQVAPNLPRLVTISLRILNARRISLAKLLAMRKREARTSTADFRKMRTRYYSALKAYADRIVNQARTPQDIMAVEEDFRASMRDDLKSLKKELRLASLEPLFSKEMAVCVLAVAGALAFPHIGIPGLAVTLKGVGVIPLIATALRHKKERRNALLTHSMSWLYYADQPRLALM
jgi:hypothetical protein